MHAVLRVVQDSRSRLSAKFSFAHRLLRENGFQHVFHAESIADRHFKILFVTNRINNARLGIIVGKKTLSGATDRNRAKRLIREAFRQHSVKLCRLDMVVILRQANFGGGVSPTDGLKALFSRLENRCAQS
jgi:ribonuclease P protein component